MSQTIRKFEAKPAVLAEVPLLIGVCGPPGGGKTLSSLRLAKGMQQVRPGPIVVIDTESGRARKYANQIEFLHVEFDPPFVPEHFLSAVHQQLPANPAAIIIDSLSDEHVGSGGVLDWHDQEVPRMGGNEWAAWARPKASRRLMINGFLQIKTPLIFTFRANEKTRLQKNAKGRDVPVNIGYQPIAPAEIVYALDLMCILPPRADGVPVWKSDKIGEDFVIKQPNFLKHCFADGALDEATGAKLATWAKGDQPEPLKTDDRFDQIWTSMLDAAKLGIEALKEEWETLASADKRALQPRMVDLKAIAEEADRINAVRERGDDNAASEPGTIHQD